VVKGEKGGAISAPMSNYPSVETVQESNPMLCIMIAECRLMRHRRNKYINFTKQVALSSDTGKLLGARLMHPERTRAILQDQDQDIKTN